MKVVGIPSYAREGEHESFLLPCGYVDAVRSVGAVPLILPPGEREPERLLDLVDGLILSGGGDIDPALYGGTAHETVYHVSRERDEFELALARAALRRPHLPLLCICRGLQLLNVLQGGTLHTHIPERFGTAITHRLPPRRPGRHHVRLEPASRFAHLLGATELEVVSWHHQAIDRIGAGLTPVAWAEDGVIEAADFGGHPWCYAVQWHPEMQYGEPAARRLFEAFAAAMGA